MPPRQAKKTPTTSRRHKKPSRPHLNLRTTEGTSRGMPAPPQTPPTLPITPTTQDSSSVSFTLPSPASGPTQATSSSLSRSLKRPRPDTPYPARGGRARSTDDSLTPPPASTDSPPPSVGANSGADTAANSNKRPRVDTGMPPPRNQVSVPVPALVDDLFSPQLHAPHAPPLPPPTASGAQWTNTEHVGLFRHVSAHGATRWGDAVPGKTASESEAAWRDTVEPFIVAQLLSKGGPGKE
ncbi:uncharacterized protein EHS24_009104 [Apiotrichum porosum]|uniref:Myb-like domain-containing protein n=1 Tax=Apiotrichum porosum TaxID=105984 RepID=A0A427XP03_9TREE|nr:uncharacterized protein EHS24_009104 [Apiotrichum porosum]RSH80524.1 hypothetical protein EHS24_009104 [Apiotrichum porosum]